jgi:hypothetical protein
MKVKNAILLSAILMVSLLFLVGCKVNVPITSQTACATDDDCACGTHIETGACFIGNKAFVNVEKQCPDFCTGIAAMFETKCVNKECKNVRIEPTPRAQPECVTADDCKPATCCHPTSCIQGKEQPECAAVLCSADCVPGTLDCGGSCACENGKCVAHYREVPAGGAVV